MAVATPGAFPATPGGAGGEDEGDGGPGYD